MQPWSPAQTDSVQNMEQALDAIAMAGAITKSYRRLTGRELIASTGDAVLDAQSLLNASAVVLAHDGADDPLFVYVNHAAARLWKRPISQMIGMPSRLSAPPEHRAERTTALALAKDAEVVTDYQGVRIAADGTRFRIEQAVLWPVAEIGNGQGQAATFTQWTTLGSSLDVLPIQVGNGRVGLLT